jgi:hypothetical protein
MGPGSDPATGGKCRVRKGVRHFFKEVIVYEAIKALFRHRFVPGIVLAFAAGG